MTDVADRAIALAEQASRPPSYETVRRHLNDVGISASRARLREAPDQVANCRLALADAKEVERQAKDAYLAAVSEAEWLLGVHFTTRSNKSWLQLYEDGQAIPEADQRSFTADERKAWIADVAGRKADVRVAMVAYSGAERARARCGDELAVDRKSVV